MHSFSKFWMMFGEKRKPRDKPTNRPPVKRQKECQDAPTTSIQPPLRTLRQNLTLTDWLSVYAYVDAHPDMSQVDIVEHFRTRHEGALIFTQPTLSRKLEQRSKMEACASDNPSALSSKRTRRIVTRPDVERALALWVQDMERRSEIVSGPMPREKRKVLEDKLQVLEVERSSGDSWVQSFCGTNEIHEIRRRGEAGSVGLKAVEESPEEAEICEKHLFATGESGEEIVTAMCHEMAVKRSDIVEVGSNDDDDPTPSVTRVQAMEMCEQLGKAVMRYGEVDDSGLVRQLCLFRAHLCRQESANAKRTTLDRFVQRTT